MNLVILFYLKFKSVLSAIGSLGTALAMSPVSPLRTHT